MSESKTEYTTENSPTCYLVEKLKQATGFEPDRDPDIFIGSLAQGALEFLCGEEPATFSDPSKYYKKNHVFRDNEPVFKCNDGSEESIPGVATLFPVTGGFVIAVNPFRHNTENDKIRSKWHELAHTLFYRWDGELLVPEYEGRGWQHTENGARLEEEICDRIMHWVFSKPLVLLGGRPAEHYSLVKKLKEEDCDVEYITDEGEFGLLLQKYHYMPWRIKRIIPYDLVIMDTGLITDEIVAHENKTTGPMDIIRDKLGEERIVHGSRAEYFLNDYFLDDVFGFENGLGPRDDTVILLADEDMADAVQDVVETREKRILIRKSYDIEEVVAEVKKGLGDRFRPLFTPKHF
ncbi:hypothetical protein KY338_02640 [Candidatus Woesearchaeota archaeon]|nr:hypothetical protein [Candidatus Woesearchaeota archaeon]MBW3005888.1 hypothetical protein [Candidatus Woesearchaeota archaeon]